MKMLSNPLLQIFNQVKDDTKQQLLLNEEKCGRCLVLINVKLKLKNVLKLL